MIRFFHRVYAFTFWGIPDMVKNKKTMPIKIAVRVAWIVSGVVYRKKD